MSSDVVVRDQQAVAVAPNPLAMVADAIQRGTDPATIKALIDLADRYEATEARKAFVTALSEFKRDSPRIVKNKDVHHNGKFMYRHATLDNVSDLICAGLSKVGISHRWDTEQLEDKSIRVTCVLTHALGHSERTVLQAAPDTSGAKNSIQAVGSTVTYLQRYTLLAATGMAVQDGTDDDGRQGKKMAEGTKADFLAAISELTTNEAAAALWQKIAAATTAAGDVEAHDEFRAAMAAKRKTIGKKEQAI